MAENKQPKLIIAIDGPSASGKGTLAKNLSNFFNVPHLDTGKMYRVFARKIIRNSLNPKYNFPCEFICSAIDEHDSSKDKYLHSEHVGNVASVIAKNPKHRQHLNHLFKTFINNSIYGAVLDGRDTAELISDDGIRIFITAPVHIRAERRFKELQRRGTPLMYKSVLTSLIQRDIRDISRIQSPLKVHKKAMIINSSWMNSAEVQEHTIRKIKSCLQYKK